MTLDSLEVRRLTSPPRSRSDINPVYSPDGQTLAFYRGSDGIYTVPVSGGDEKRLTTPSYGWRLAWTLDGRNIVFPDAGWLWKIYLGGGEPESLQFGQDGFQPSIRNNR
jgi:Tol biopolymer transport system component